MHFISICAAPLAFLLTASAVAAAPWQATLVQQSGSMRLTYAGQEMGTLEPMLCNDEWNTASVQMVDSPNAPAAQAGTYRSKILAPNGSAIDTVTSIETVQNGLHAHYELTPQKDVHLNSLHIGITFPVQQLLGGNYVANGVSSPIPTMYKVTHVFHDFAKSFVFQFPGKPALQFQFSSPTQFLLQDDRLWNENFTIRIAPQVPESLVWTAGKTYVVDFTLTTPEGFTMGVDKPVTITAGDDWIPLENKLEILPGTALDFSHIVPWHSPAGDYGRVIANNNGHFVFEKRPKEPLRFYGVNLIGTGQYLTHEESDRFATRLQRLGYNAVRLHHYDNVVIDHSKGDSLHFNSNALDQLDYFFAAMKKHGIYVTTDLYVSRVVLAKELWDNEPGNVDFTEYKMAILVNERAFNNFIAFSTELLTHKNPYTGMRWADDPALAWISLINEGNDWGDQLGSIPVRLQPDWTRAWNAWLAARYPSRDALVKAIGPLDPSQDPAKGTVPMPKGVDDSPKGKLLSCFLAENHTKFFQRTKKILRDTIGCNALLTNLNGGNNPVQSQATRQDFDYIDDHFYIDHPQFLGTAWELPSRCPNTSPVADGVPGGRNCAFTRMLDKPFAVTEFNYSAPGRFRGVGGMLTSAMGAIQDWSAIWRFAYSHSRNGVINVVPMDYFNLGGDPLNQAADRAAICLFRRGDMSPAKHTIGIVMTKDELLHSPATDHLVKPGWNGMALVTKVGMQVIDAQHPAKADIALPLTGKPSVISKGTKWFEADPYNAATTTTLFTEIRKRGWISAKNTTDGKTPNFQSENGELTVNGSADLFTLDTDRTAGGFAPAGTTLTLKAGTITIEKTDATVWVSSLDQQSIAKSGRLLITHLTDLQNTDIKYAEQAKRVLLSWGKLPHLVAAGSATVRLRLAHPEKAKVWGLATDGARLEPITTHIENGMLVIPLNVNNSGKARIMYEVEIQK